MPTPPPLSFLTEELQELKQKWIWFLILGIGLILLGFLAIGSPFIAGMAVITVLGCFLIVGGILQIIAAFWTRGWGGFFLNLLVGILYFVVGVVMLERTEEALLFWTLFIAVALIIGGIFRIVASLTNQFAGYGWVLAGGIIDLILGIMIWRQWPASALWVIGLFLGISLLFNGSTWVALGLSIREIPSENQTEPPAETPGTETSGGTTE